MLELLSEGRIVAVTKPSSAGSVSPEKLDVPLLEPDDERHSVESFTEVFAGI